MQPANLIATVPVAYWNEPRLLWDAKPPTTPPLTLSVQNGQLTIARPANMVGIYYVEVTVSDGITSTKKTFQLTLN